MMKHISGLNMSKVLVIKIQFYCNDKKKIRQSEDCLTLLLNEHYFFFDFTLSLKNLQEILNFFNVTWIIKSKKAIDKTKYVTALMSSIIDEMFIRASVSGDKSMYNICRIS